MSTSETIQSLENEVANLESEFRKAANRVLLPGLATFTGLCVAAFTLRLIMEEGNPLPAFAGLVVGIAGLVFVVIGRKKFDAAKRQLEAKRAELARLKQGAPQAQPIPVEPSVSDPVALSAQRIAAGLCPKCGSRVAPTDTNCPSCRINLAFAREHPDQW